MQFPLRREAEVSATLNVKVMFVPVSAEADVSV
jgi:hypothetical protein